MLGVRQLYEATDLRGADPSAVAAVVVAMAGLPVRLRRLPADSPLLAHLPLVRERGALVRTLPVVGTPTISLDERWTEPEHHFSSRRRSDLRVARRRAEALGEVTISVEEPAPGTVGPLFDEAVAVEAAGWKRRAATALAVQPRPRAFFRRLCELAAEQGVLRLAFLRIGGRPAAVQIAAEQHGRYSLFKIGFDEQFARCSPGNLLLLYSVRRAAELGLRSFDFLGAAEPWTELWTTEVRPCIDLSVYPRSPWSPLAAGEDAARATAKWVLARRRQPAG
jgi:CelD/BcsL family acetyltransferase involved in cellulose biosynthesis